jgi:hypothetical protein
VEWLCKILPLEVLVPLLARTRLLVLAIQAAYLEPVAQDLQLHRLIGESSQKGWCRSFPSGDEHGHGLEAAPCHRAKPAAAP